MKSMKAMRRTHLLVILIGVIAIGIFTADAAAMYHPGMGRFMQRDPGAGGEHRIGAGGQTAATSRFIPRDPTGSNQYADGMNLYQYVGSSPIVNIDPSGEITVSAVKSNLKVSCGDTAWIQWDFKLDNKASCDGYIVQQVDYRCTVKDDCKKCPNSSPVRPDVSFWEAWFVKKGDDLHALRNRVSYTDRSGIAIPKNTCGNISAVGTIKFFCKSTTGDLGSFGKSRPGSGWSVNALYGKGPHCRTSPGILPSTGTQPAWWNNKAVEGPTQRWSNAFWNCCGSCKDVSADASPK